MRGLWCSFELTWAGVGWGVNMLGWGYMTFIKILSIETGGDCCLSS